MATFKAKIRKRRANGMHTVYILCSHNRSIQYIRTDLVVSDKGLSKDNEITDKRVLLRASALINSYYDTLQGKRISNLTAKEVVGIITGKDGEGISFTDFAQRYIIQREKQGIKRVRLYKQALNSYLSHLGKDSLLFEEVTSRSLRDWIEQGLKDTKRAKSMYPSLLKLIFTAGLAEYNDYDRDVLRITNRPFEFLKIPKDSVAKKRSVSPSVLRAFFSHRPSGERAQIAQDVLRLSFCLAGMNVADLYQLTPANYKGGKICYERVKTRGKRDDKAYLEVTLPPEAAAALERLKRGAEKGRLLNLSARYGLPDVCTVYVSSGAKKICGEAGLEPMTSYSFRHSWATIARNDVGASEEDVAFALNHVSAHRVTDRYIRKDFTRIDRLNEKVLALVFGEGEE